MNTPLSNPAYKLNSETLSDTMFVKEHPFELVFTRRRVVFYMDGYRYAHDAAQKRWGIPFAFYETGRSPIKQVYLSSNLNEAAADFWLLKIQANPGFVDDLVEELRGVIKKAAGLSVWVSSVELTPDMVTDALERHLAWWTEFFTLAHLWFAVDIIKKRTDEEIQNTWPDNTNFLDRVYRPTELPTSSREQRDLVRIAHLEKEKRKQALVAHQARYGHLALHNVDDARFDLMYYESRLHEFESQDELERQEQAFKEADEELCVAARLREEAPISAELKKRIELVQQFMFLRTESIEHMMLVADGYKPIFAYLAERLKFPEEMVLNMTYKELIDSIQDPATIPKEQILARVQDGYGYFVGPHTSALVTGPDIEELQEICLGIAEKLVVKEVSGTSAYPGKVRGITRIIIDRRMADKLREGEILVTAMTAPDFVPAMKRAAAIVTNEGGILCHAAIMSRELKKPCIIGTKIATQVLKDGDLVEVDANAGVVRIL